MLPNPKSDSVPLDVYISALAAEDVP
ncbi:MAG: hypothetical protein H6Q04_957, partial [Acidobacteria bacterium]|nr:hypothetical protein [Acidobacteriota bacterium]